MADSRSLPALSRKSARRLALAFSPLPVVVIFGSWYFTEPLDGRSRPLPASTRLAGTARDDRPSTTAVIGTDATARAMLDRSDRDDSQASEPAVWPDERLDGEAAKRRLLAVLLPVQERLRNVSGYTATFRKQERIGGELRPWQTMAMKVRHEPFSVYLKFLAPKAGKEVIYSAGRYDDHLIGHNGDWSRLLVPRLKLAPTDALALADNRHPITDAGLLNLINKLVRFRELDLGDPAAETVLDRTVDEQGRTWCRSLHTHAHHDEKRPFTRVEVLYDPETLVPHSIAGYDWPEEGSGSEPQLGEWYVYDDIQFDAELNDMDFDPANEEYAFSRF